MEVVGPALDFGFWAALIAGIATPTVFQFFKDWGGNWPQWLKYGLSLVFAALASFLAIGQSQGWDVVALNDWSGFWVPLIGGMAVTFPVQLSTYTAFWKDTKLGTAVGNITVLNNSSAESLPRAA